MIKHEELTDDFYNEQDEYQRYKALVLNKKYFEKELDPKIGFDIGWDYYAFKLAFPAYMEQYKCIRDGFDSARAKKVNQKTHNEYVRKWLLLRYNAWKRSRHFDASVNPEFIEFIADSKRCPITQEPFTKNTGLGTDWSIDRVNNDGGYCVGNLVVVSVRANVLKNNHDFASIVGFAYDDNAEIPGDFEEHRALTRHEWARWAFICSQAPFSDVDDEGKIDRCPIIVPAVVTPPNGMADSPEAVFQMVIAQSVFDYNEYYTRVMSAVPKIYRKEFNGLVAKGKKIKYQCERYTQIWHNVSLFKKFMEVFNSMPYEVASKAADEMSKRMEIGHRVKEKEINLAFDSKGYTK